jgi:hypothetical protein
VKRIVFTVATGAPRYAEMALGLARSLELIGDRTPRVAVSDVDEPKLASWFDQVILPQAGEGNAASPYLKKLAALELTDADAALFIDADSLVFRRLDEIFEHCQGMKLAVQGAIRRQGHWYGDLSAILPRHGLDGIQRFNGGMIYYERHPDTERLFAKTREIAENYDETGLERFRGQVPDEPCLSLAMSLTGVGELLQNELDFMNTPVGLVGKLHLSVRRNECFFVKRGNEMRFVRPAILHAAKYVNNWAYWRELRELESLSGA